MNNNNMYAMVIFLLVISNTISLVLCSSSNNDEVISMVVEEKTPYMQPSGIMDQNPVQLGRFSLKDGRLVTLSRHVNGKENSCVPPDDPCGALDWCCEGLTCDGYFDGRCKRDADCLPAKSGCGGLTEPCCYPYRCNALKYGQCV
uniref:uncharacterized protein LOC122597330 n=1 Tax=Erigeron canadensis TaxID=72917 RepID=UPI001CB986A2|nr:uncharacterized protein LOC122597330 [Erigeron canadensis]